MTTSEAPPKVIPRSKSERVANVSKAAKSLCAGGLSGAISRTAVAPLERIKILFQVQHLSVPEQAAPRHTSLIQSFADLVRRQGFGSLWQGNGVNCIRIVPQSAIQFFCFEQYCQQLLGKSKNEATALERLVVGGAAGATAQTCTYPLDLMRARLAVDFRGQYTGLLSALRQVAAKEGLRGLFKGLVPTLCGVIPYVGTDFVIFGEMKKLLADERGQLSVQRSLLAGGVAGMAGQTIAFPLDTVRRTLQVQAHMEQSGKSSASRHGAMLDCIQTIWHQSGWRGFMRGYLPALISSGPRVGIQFAAYEFISEYIIGK